MILLQLLHGLIASKVALCLMLNEVLFWISLLGVLIKPLLEGVISNFIDSAFDMESPFDLPHVSVQLVRLLAVAGFYMDPLDENLISQLLNWYLCCIRYSGLFLCCNNFTFTRTISCIDLYLNHCFSIHGSVCLHKQSLIFNWTCRTVLNITKTLLLSLVVLALIFCQNFVNFEFPTVVFSPYGPNKLMLRLNTILGLESIAWMPLDINPSCYFDKCGWVVSLTSRHLNISFLLKLFLVDIFFEKRTYIHGIHTQGMFKLERKCLT